MPLPTVILSIATLAFTGVGSTRTALARLSAASERVWLLSASTARHTGGVPEPPPAPRSSTM